MDEEGLRIQVGRTYRTREGTLAYIMGPARTAAGRRGEAFWSLQGAHYGPDGRCWGHTAETGPMLLPYEHAKNLVEEVPTPPEWEGLSDRVPDMSRSSA